MGLPPPLVLVGTGVVFLGNLLHIIGLATPHWIEVEVLGVKAHGFIFKSCPRENCQTIDDPSSELEAVQAMAILGMLCGLAGGAMALLFVIFHLLSKSPPKILGVLCAVACGAAFVFIIIAVAVFASEIYDDNAYTDLGYSFGLTITGGILMLIGGILFFLGAKSVS